MKGLTLVFVGVVLMATAVQAEPDPARPAPLAIAPAVVEPDFPSPRPAPSWGHPAIHQIQATSPAGPFTGIPDWDATAYCESHGQWNINSGNGYWGGLQFAESTWFAYGGGPFDGVGWFPYSREEQIVVAERVLAAQGPGAWPNCFRWAP